MHRERTQFYDLRIYDTQELGRILWLNGYVQLTLQFLQQNYAGNMCDQHIQRQLDLKQQAKDESPVEVLVIGGGDLLVAYYLLEKYGTQTRITIVDQDEKVTQAVRQYFQFGAKVDEHIKTGTVKTLFEEGSQFAAKVAAQGEKFNAVFVDISSDAITDDSPAQTLTTETFFAHLGKTLRPSGGLIYNIYSQDEVATYFERWTKTGFVDCSETKIEQLGREFIFGSAHKPQ